MSKVFDSGDTYTFEMRCRQRRLGFDLRYRRQPSHLLTSFIIYHINTHKHTQPNKYIYTNMSPHTPLTQTHTRASPHPHTHTRTHPNTHLYIIIYNDNCLQRLPKENIHGDSAKNP